MVTHAELYSLLSLIVSIVTLILCIIRKKK